MVGPAEHVPIVVVGAGPCGLACARELGRLGFQDFTVLEKESYPGGLASSLVDEAGFTWDRGGHVVFSSYGEFDAMLAEVMGADVYEHERSSYIHFGQRWVPYPFQNNLHRLPPDQAWECVLGLAEAPGARDVPRDADFLTWSTRVFGAGITRLFMAPYNTKVWSYPMGRMSAAWFRDRISVVSPDRALRGLLSGQDDLGWGPNRTFLFPRSGGTGEIYRRLAATLPGKVRYGTRLTGVDHRARSLTLSSGQIMTYDCLVSTVPIVALVRYLDQPPQQVRHAAARLRWNSVAVVGVGYDEPTVDRGSWFYFPENDVPFYRVTNFGKYSADNVPEGRVDRYSAYLTETAYSAHRPLPPDLVGRTDKALRSVGFVGADAGVCTVSRQDIRCAYPIPTLDRDEALATVQRWLMSVGVYSRGRLGAWRYEIGNMDHATKMGIDVARHLVTGADEEVWSLT